MITAKFYLKYGNIKRRPNVYMTFRKLILIKIFIYDTTFLVSLDKNKDDNIQESINLINNQMNINIYKGTILQI